MPRIKCPKCNKAETVLRSGFIRNKQRYYCKECNYHFTLYHKKQNAKSNSDVKKHQTTIIDIAKAMGVSATTVSRALHEHPDISLKTRDAIKALAVEMDYRPNLLAKGFANKKTQTIGVIIPNLETTFFSSMLSGIHKVASAADYKVMICQSNESHKTEVDNLQTLMTNWIDGLLICHSIDTRSFEHIKSHLHKGIPIVHFYRVCTETDTPKVICEDIEGAEKMTEHLIMQGCTRIAVIAGPKDLLISQKRLQGYKNVIKKHGLPYRENLVAHTDFVRDTIVKVVDNWLNRQEQPDAIFSISDKCAIYTMQYLKEKGIKIPEEICVAGFGNEYVGEVIEPGLTSFDVHTNKIGEEAAQLFFDQLHTPDENKIITKIVKGDLIIRGSTLRNKQEI